MALVFDAGALIALEREEPRMKALAVVVGAKGIPVYVPAGVVAQVWRGTPRQHRLSGLLATGVVRVDVMDETTAKAVGVLLRGAGTSDVVDGHVALLGRRTGGTVFTSDEDDIRRIDPSLDIVAV